MVTLERSSFTDKSRSDEYRGKSTDEKPTKNVENGSTFYEFDTVKLYVFDKETEQWIKQ